MANDYHLAEYLRARIQLLDPFDRHELDQCLNALLADPEPNGIDRIEAPPYFPYRAGAITMHCGKFRINYEIANDGMVIHIFSIQPLPTLP
jgi:hypothetical protein